MLNNNLRDDGFNFMIRYLEQKLTLLKEMRDNSTVSFSEQAILSTEENIIKIYAKLMVFINMNPEKKDEYERYIELDNILYVINCGDVVSQIIHSKGIGTFADLIDLGVKKYFKWIKNVSDTLRVERFLTAIKMLQFYYDSFVDGSSTSGDIWPDFHLPMVSSTSSQFNSCSLPQANGLNFDGSIFYDYVNTVINSRSVVPVNLFSKSGITDNRLSLTSNFNMNSVSATECINEKSPHRSSHNKSSTTTQNEEIPPLERPHNRKEIKHLDQCIVCKGYIVLGLKCKDCRIRIHEKCMNKVSVECAAIRGDLLVLCDIKGYDVCNESTTLTALFDEDSTDVHTSTRGTSSRSSKIGKKHVSFDDKLVSNTKSSGMFKKLIKIHQNRPNLVDFSHSNPSNVTSTRTSTNTINSKYPFRNPYSIKNRQGQKETDPDGNPIVESKSYRNSSNTSYTKPPINDPNKTIYDENDENQCLPKSKSMDLNTTEGPSGFRKLKTRASMLSDWLIDINDLKIYEVTRFSRFGVVKRAQWHGEVSMLILNEHLISREEFSQFRNKIFLLRRTRHENLKLFMGLVATPPIYGILTNLDAGVSLYYIIHERDNIYAEFSSIPLLIQINNALGYLHSKGIIHCNLNTKSVLVDNKKICLCDFGLISPQNQQIYIPRDEKRRQLKLPHYWVRTQPPEVLKLLHPDEPAREIKIYSRHTDMYSLGILWYEMITGSVPFYHNDISTFIYCQCSGFNCKLKFKTIPKEIMVAILSCISRNSDYRTNCNDLKPILFKLEKISRVMEHRVKKKFNRLSAHL